MKGFKYKGLQRVQLNVDKKTDMISQRFLGIVDKETVKESKT